MDLVLIGAFVAMVCWGIGDYCIQRSARVMGDVEALTWIGVIGAIGLLPFIIPQLGELGVRGNVALLLLLGLVTFAAAILDFEALKIGKLSVIEMVVSLELPFTILLGALFFNDIITVWQVVIILILMWGVALTALTPAKIHFRWEKGIFLALATAILMALVNFLTALSAKEITPLLAVWVPWVIFTIICLVIIWKRNGTRTFFSHARHHTKLIVIMGVFDTVAWIAYAYATSNGELGIITAITESYPAIALALGVWLNKEKIQEHQYLGAGLALVASFLLAMTL
jgi:drug/metabolite transporter (DMT)-like permease